MQRADAQRLLAGIDPVAAKLYVTEVTGELDGLAAQVWAFGLAEGARRAVAIVAQMGAELAVGAAHLYEAERWYAGAALVRQLIETEYLLFLFAVDSSEPEKWLRATPEQAKRVFAPANMRERSSGRFRAEEYSIHCEIGGHPRLSGHFLLREHLTPVPGDVPRLFDPRAQWVDLGQHVERLWTNYAAAVRLHSPSNVYPDRFRRLDDLSEAWRAIDPLPSRI
jgi:hypothetical protein